MSRILIASIGLLTAIVNSHSSLVPDPLHYYALGGDSTDYTVSDSGSDPANGFFSGFNGLTWSNGQKNNALKFDGVSSDYVSIGGGTLSSDWTVAFWVNLDSFPDLGVTSYAALGGTATGLKVAQLGNGNIGYTEYGVQDYNFTTSLIPGNWNHLAFVKDENGIKLFLDGVYSDSLPYPIDLTLESIGYASDADYLGGTLDELKVWDSALTEEQVASLIQVSSIRGGDKHRVAEKKLRAELLANKTLILHTPMGTAFTIYDTFGRIQLRGISGENAQPTNLSFLSNGLYLVETVMNGKKAVQTILVK